MTGGTQFYVVDRIEGRVVIIIGDDRRSYDVPLTKLPTGIAEDAVLRVPRDAGGEPDWKRAALDPAERERRIARSREIYDELRKQDPGGDVKL
ncbi:MAG: hypothetical protein A2083_05185 [Gemmatimonadetes bacterium GWC2_71_9]|nr:MAG: hypothetical protein A2083_05185 [Gemmatimonadetes bacterium GWC2_71_9]